MFAFLWMVIFAFLFYPFALLAPFYACALVVYSFTQLFDLETCRKRWITNHLWKWTAVMIRYQSSYLKEKVVLFCLCICLLWGVSPHKLLKNHLFVYIYIQDVKLEGNHCHRAAIWNLLALAFLALFAYLVSNHNEREDEPFRIAITDWNHIIFFLTSGMMIRMGDPYTHQFINAHRTRLFVVLNVHTEKCLRMWVTWW